MAFVRSVRRLHRRLAIVLGVQLALWTASGIYFAWTDIDAIRGDALRTEPPVIQWSSEWIAPAEIDFRSAGRDVPETLAAMDVVDVLGVAHYRLRGVGGEVVLADARTGRIRGPLVEEEAVALARASFAPDAPVAAVRRITTADVDAHHEYREQPLPAWRVDFDHPTGTRVYVAAHEGVVVRHRNARWRIFDFLWMLHTMDYVSRDDFNNPVLRVVALAALVAILSGVVLWVRTRPRRAIR